MKLGIIGVGQMGNAILTGIVKSESIAQTNIGVFDQSAASIDRVRELAPQVYLADSAEKLCLWADMILFALKPNQMNDTLSGLTTALENKALLSIVSGMSTASLKKSVPESCRVQRTMPNMPAMVREGVTLLSLASDFTEAEKAFVEVIVHAIGAFYWVDESMINAGTAISGSGPAYAFIFMEALADGAVREGLPRALSLQLAAQTLLGAARVLQQTNTHPGALKDAVCSPGGTTIEAVGVLERMGFRASIIEAVHACAEKAALQTKQAEAQEGTGSH